MGTTCCIGGFAAETGKARVLPCGETGGETGGDKSRMVAVGSVCFNGTIGSEPGGIVM